MTNIPSYQLDVNGDIRAVNIIETADIRFKKSIAPLTNSLESVLKLQCVNFMWNTKDYPEHKFSKDKQIGFIAQDVEKIVPQIVTTDNSGYKNMNYNKLTALLVEGMKNQQKQIDYLYKILDRCNKCNKCNECNKCNKCNECNKCNKCNKCKYCGL